MPTVCWAFPSTGGKNDLLNTHNFCPVGVGNSFNRGTDNLNKLILINVREFAKLTKDGMTLDVLQIVTHFPDNCPTVFLGGSFFQWLILADDVLEVFMKFELKSLSSPIFGIIAFGFA